MREVIFDTETTGLDSSSDRIIEIGGIELIDRFPSGETFHVYINPEDREVHPDALAVHGISNADLADKPVFSQIAEEFTAFFSGAKLVAHNAGFDVGFLNAELARAGLPALDQQLIVDTLALARRKHPMGPNSLDALCRRYGIDNSRREKHGALLDSELLAEVYIELAGGKQAALRLVVDDADDAASDAGEKAVRPLPERPTPLQPRLSAEEIAAHTALMERLGPESVWAKINAGQA